MSAELQSAVVGATGYSGQELTRILFQHPRMKPPLLLSRETDDGNAPGEIISPVDGTAVPIHPFSWRLLHQRGVDLLYLATPHEVSREWVPQAIARGLRVIDLSGAWRLRTHQYAAAYGFKDIGSPASDALMEKALYGLPELCRNRLPDAQLVANPGCYPTSAILALAPLLQAGLLDVEHGVVCDAKSGVSGAGKSPTPQTISSRPRRISGRTRRSPIATPARSWSSCNWRPRSWRSVRTCCPSGVGFCRASMPTCNARSRRRNWKN